MGQGVGGEAGVHPQCALPLTTAGHGGQGAYVIVGQGAGAGDEAGGHPLYAVPADDDYAASSTPGQADHAEVDFSAQNCRSMQASLHGGGAGNSAC